MQIKLLFECCRRVRLKLCPGADGAECQPEWRQVDANLNGCPHALMSETQQASFRMRAENERLKSELRARAAEARKLEFELRRTTSDRGILEEHVKSMDMMDDMDVKRQSQVSYI